MNKVDVTRKKAMVAACSMLLVGASGCGQRYHLTPAPNVAVAPHNDQTAVATVDGVQLNANGDAWNARPVNLPDVITPVRVTIRNNSGKPLRVQYRDFSLITSFGASFRALPPFRISGSVPSAPVAVAGPAFYGDGFMLAPDYGPYYGGFGLWDGPFDYDFPYYTTYYAQWPVALPTKDMLRDAIPEGVLTNGGRLSGFLYFSRVPKSVRDVTLDARLINARTRSRIGNITIPFEVKK